ncbi:MAG TPA: hypothetical protein VFS21_04495, partial [Roseiflexaceae bacterium]|nr:hypothetical protein [Roseiflexaceae bacterium]
HILAGEGSDINLRRIYYFKKKPRVVVMPHRGKEEDGDMIKMRISVVLVYDEQETDLPKIWVCPLLGDVQEFLGSDAIEIKSLDGHVVVWIDNKPFISCFSHGGNPPTHTTGQIMGNFATGDVIRQKIDRVADNAAGEPEGSSIVNSVVTPSITAGSSDGMIRIYFTAEDRLSDYSSIRFVVTVQNDINSYVIDNEAKAMSYPFSIACSENVHESGLSMTMEVRYNPMNIPKDDNGRLRICRLLNGAWHELPTYSFSSLGVSAVATFFDKRSVNCAFYEENNTQLFEQYQLWWIPNTPTTGPIS